MNNRKYGVSTAVLMIGALLTFPAELVGAEENESEESLSQRYRFSKRIDIELLPKRLYQLQCKYYEVYDADPPDGHIQVQECFTLCQKNENNPNGDYTVTPLLCGTKIPKVKPGFYWAKKVIDDIYLLKEVGIEHPEKGHNSTTYHEVIMTLKWDEEAATGMPDEVTFAMPDHDDAAYLGDHAGAAHAR